MVHQRSWLLPSALLLSCCGPSDRSDVQPADFVIMRDLSTSAPLSTDRAFAARAAQRVESDLLRQHPMLGDRVLVLAIGARSTHTAIAWEIPLNRQNRPSAAAALVGRVIAATPDSPDRGQAATDILFSLLHTGFSCSARGMIWVVSDGLQSDDRDFSRPSGLLNGSADLPAPEARRLRGCRIRWLGMGLTSSGTEQFSSAQLTKLEGAWRRWLIAAGVQPSDIEIISGF